MYTKELNCSVIIRKASVPGRGRSNMHAQFKTKFPYLVCPMDSTARYPDQLRVIARSNPQCNLKRINPGKQPCVFIQAVVLRVKKKIAMVARGVRKPHEQCDQSTQASSPLSTISRVWEGEACWEVWHAVGQSADAEWEALDELRLI